MSEDVVLCCSKRYDLFPSFAICTDLRTCGGTTSSSFTTAGLGTSLVVRPPSAVLSFSESGSTKGGRSSVAKTSSREGRGGSGAAVGSSNPLDGFASTFVELLDASVLSTGYANAGSGPVLSKGTLFVG